MVKPGYIYMSCFNSLSLMRNKLSYSETNAYFHVKTLCRQCSLVLVTKFINDQNSFGEHMFQAMRRI